MSDDAAAARTGSTVPGASPRPAARPADVGVLLIVVAVVVALVAAASGYGYHRDELYFLAAGRHLALAYPDQGPLVPLLARAMSTIAPGSLTMLRLPSALAAGGVVLLTGLLAGELGGRPRAQRIAAATAALAVIVLFTGHTLSTSTLDLLVWTVAGWLAVRAIRTGADRLWLLVGVVLGVGLLNKPMPAFLAAGLLAAVVISGPRRLLHNRYLWLGAALAGVIWSPWLVWQGMHGWPQLAVAHSIAAGGSASSTPWWQVVPFQVLLAGPLLAPVWIAGLVRLFRDPGLRRVRLFGWVWVLLAVTFMAVGGKAYYLAGLLPLLIGAGAAPLDDWLATGRRRVRVAVLACAIAVSAAASAIIALPVLPARDAGPVVAMNPDVGETIGWPDLVATVARVWQRLPAGAPAVIFTANYGEAGAIDRYGPGYGLPHAYSGHNAYGRWGPPPDGAAPVIVVGLPKSVLAAHFRDCSPAGRIGNTAGIHNDEHGRSIAVCAGPRGSWGAIWPALRRLG